MHQCAKVRMWYETGLWIAFFADNRTPAEVLQLQRIIYLVIWFQEDVCGDNEHLHSTLACSLYCMSSSEHQEPNVKSGRNQRYGFSYIYFESYAELGSFVPGFKMYKYVLPIVCGACIEYWKRLSIKNRPSFNDSFSVFNHWLWGLLKSCCDDNHTFWCRYSLN